MPFTPLVVGDVVEVRVVGLCKGQQVINRYHWVAIAGTVGGPPTDTQQIAIAMRLRYQSQMIPVMYTSYSVLNYFVGVITNVTRNAGPPVTYTLTYRDQTIEVGTAADVGTLALVDQLPTFDAMDLQRVCGVRNKFSRGSVRISPHDEQDQKDGSFLDPRPGDIKTAITAFHTAQAIPIGGPLVTLQPIVFSAANSAGQPYPFGTRSEWLVQYVPNRLVSSQVSRKTRNRGY